MDGKSRKRVSREVQDTDMGNAYLLGQAGSGRVKWEQDEMSRNDVDTFFRALYRRITRLGDQPGNNPRSREKID